MLKKGQIQRFPSSGPLKENMNLSLVDLKSKIGPLADKTALKKVVRRYVVNTIYKGPNGVFEQTGSAPNFQGGLITLCTCKHQMRSGNKHKYWNSGSVWIAGFSGKTHYGEWALVYLMRVKHAFESFSDLWYSQDIPGPTKSEKNAGNCIFGDLYEPKELLEIANRWNHRFYRVPCSGHAHENDNNWWKDIEHRYHIGTPRRPCSLLVGDRDHSFLWTAPQIYPIGELRVGESTIVSLLEFIELKLEHRDREHCEAA